jgi:hypothetical protein
MYGDTAGNATDEWSKRKYSSPINDKDSSRSDSSKRPKDDARKDCQDGRKYEGKPTIA